MATIDEALEQAFAELGDSGHDEGSEAVEEEAETEEVEATEDEAEEQPEDETEEPTEGEESEDGDEVEEEESPGPRVIEVDDDDVLIRLPDGTEVPVKDGVLRHGDYTKKTQELAEQRREAEQLKTEAETKAAEAEQLYTQVATWYEDRAGDPAAFMVELASDSENATVTVARALKQMADSGVLDSEFVEMFGLKSGEVANRAQRGEADDRLAKVEAQLEEERQRSAREKAQEQAVTQVLQDWDALLTERGVTFESPADADAHRREVLTFAVEHEIADLKVAYAAWQGMRAPTEIPAPVTPPKRVVDEVTARKKRATAAMAPRSAGGSAAPAKKAVTVEDAALQSLDEWTAARA